MDNNFGGFLSTLSLRRATSPPDSCYLDNIISIHALLAESDYWPCIFVVGCPISIHALLAESDSGSVISGSRYRHFYPRSPCGERPYQQGDVRANQLFLSTLSLRRATLSPEYFLTWHLNFYPRSPCGERLNECCKFSWNNRFLSTLSLRRATVISQAIFIWVDISIHALLAESDAVYAAVQSPASRFLSTLSLRRATRRSVKLFRQNYISIHALLAESD